MKVDREKLSWAAGFFDGEGSTTYDSQCLRKDGSIYKNPLITISQAHYPELLNKFQEIFGLGKVYKNNKDVYRYRVKGFEKVQAIVAMMWVFLGSQKRQQATSVLNDYIAHMREHRKPGRPRRKNI